MNTSRGRRPVKTVQYAVEKIIAKRIHNGKVQYYLKWQGYPDTDNSWVNEEDLSCDELRIQFEERQIGELYNTNYIVDNRICFCLFTEERLSNMTEKCGFSRGLVAESIYSATNTNGIVFVFIYKQKSYIPYSRLSNYV